MASRTLRQKGHASVDERYQEFLTWEKLQSLRITTRLKYDIYIVIINYHLVYKLDLKYLSVRTIAVYYMSWPVK